MQISRLALRIMDWGGPDALLAEYCKIPYPTMSLYLSGKRGISAPRIIVLSQALRCKPADILGWASERECPVIDDDRFADRAPWWLAER